jgi:HAD superfamily hydrolase (TIGR01509 family)
MQYQAVIFDMDGLMLNTELLGKEAWSVAVESLGHSLPSEIFLDMVGRNKTASAQVLLDHFGPDFPVEKARDIRKEIGRRPESIAQIKTQPGLIDLLNFLKQAGIPRAVATSSDYDTAIHHLTAVNIISFFDTIVTGNMVNRSKPEPDIFIEAATRLKVGPSRCIILEDSENGIKAAHAAGAIPIMIPDLKAPTPQIRQLTHAICNSLSDALTLIREDFTYNSDK